MKCPYCKEEIIDGSIKCKHCGSNLKKINIKKYGLYALVFIFISTVSFGAYTFITPNFYEKKECHTKVIEQMKDPDSVEFIGDNIINDTPISQYGVHIYQITITGNYKAKNSFGAFMTGEFVCNKIGNEGNMTAQVGEGLEAYKKGLEIVTDGNNSYKETVDKLNSMKQ